MGRRLGIGWAIVVAGTWAATSRADEVRTIYPLTADGATSAQVAEVQKLLQSILEKREPRAPPIRLAAPTCGPSRKASLTCLSRIDPDGLVLFGEVHRARDELVILLGVVDRRARKFGPARASIYPDFPDRKALLVDVELLEAQATPPKADDFRLVTSTTPVNAGVTPDSAPTSWKSSAAPWTLASGLVLLAGGGVVGLLDRQLDGDLEARYASRTLTPADADNFKRVGTYNLAANGLFIAGTLLSAASIWMWSTIPVVTPNPGGGADVSVRGTF